MPEPRRHSRAYLGLILGRPARMHDIWRHFYAFAQSLLDRLRAADGRRHRCESDGPSLEPLFAAHGLAPPAFPGHLSRRRLRSARLPPGGFPPAHPSRPPADGQLLRHRPAGGSFRGMDQLHLEQRARRDAVCPQGGDRCRRFRRHEMRPPGLQFEAGALPFSRRQASLSLHDLSSRAHFPAARRLFPWASRRDPGESLVACSSIFEPNGTPRSKKACSGRASTSRECWTGGKDACAAIPTSGAISRRSIPLSCPRRRNMAETIHGDAAPFLLLLRLCPLLGDLRRGWPRPQRRLRPAAASAAPAGARRPGPARDSAAVLPPGSNGSTPPGLVSVVWHGRDRRELPARSASPTIPACSTPPSSWPACPTLSAFSNPSCAPIRSWLRPRSWPVTSPATAEST